MGNSLSILSRIENVHVDSAGNIVTAINTIHVTVCLSTGDTDIVFPTEGKPTAEDIRNEVRSTYVLTGGILKRNGIALLGSTVLQAGQYHFVDGVPTGPPQKSGHVFLSWMNNAGGLNAWRLPSDESFPLLRIESTNKAEILAYAYENLNGCNFVTSELEILQLVSKVGTFTFPGRYGECGDNVDSGVELYLCARNRKHT